MVVIGLLILVPSGLCTSFFSLSMLFRIVNGARHLHAILILSLLIGSAPIMIGTTLLIAGWKSRKTPNSR